MKFYNPNATTKVIVDGSPVGLGAILTQEQPDGSFKPVMYGSSSLTPTQQRYSQTEREALAILWACKHFHHYLYDRRFTVVTDHKPLLGMFVKKSEPPARIQRWMLQLQAYDFAMEHIPGTQMASDYLSRMSTNDDTFEEFSDCYVNMIVDHSIPKACTNVELHEETNKDSVIQKVMQSVVSGKWESDDEVQRFHKVRDSLSVKNNFLLKGNRLVLPTTLQEKVLQLAHYTQHQGVQKTKALLREKVWWPSLDADVEAKVRCCHACQVTTHYNSVA